ncbi:hypothetical protein B0H14DRAFT_3138895 [Mycena olivaceomarginata]|nr:hypothetical protein B0H14DRAFT_3138895 [Mycena olivaceomarginata]
MNGDEDEAGAVHDNAGVHSDGPGGVSEAGVVHASVHFLGDILRAVHATAEAGSKVGNTEDMRGGVSKVARRHARRRGRHRGRCAQFGGCPQRCARRGGMHGGSDRLQRVAGSKTSRGRQWPRFVWWELMWIPSTWPENNSDEMNCSVKRASVWLGILYVFGPHPHRNMSQNTSSLAERLIMTRETES